MSLSKACSTTSLRGARPADPSPRTGCACNASLKVTGSRFPCAGYHPGSPGARRGRQCFASACALPRSAISPLCEITIPRTGLSCPGECTGEALDCLCGNARSAGICHRRLLGERPLWPGYCHGTRVHRRWGCAQRGRKRYGRVRAWIRPRPGR